MTPEPADGPSHEPNEPTNQPDLPNFGPIEAKFPLGQLVMTRGVASEVAPEHVLEVVSRHARGDWGDLDEDDKQANELAIKIGDRVLSAYWVPSALDGDGEVRLYVITEAGRSLTTVLLTDEY